MGAIYDKDILSIIWKFSHKFDNKTPLAFSKWLNVQNVDLTDTDPERKIVKTNESVVKLRKRELQILDDTYYGKLKMIIKK